MANIDPFNVGEQFQELTIKEKIDKNLEEELNRAYFYIKRIEDRNKRLEYDLKDFNRRGDSKEQSLERAGSEIDELYTRIKLLEDAQEDTIERFLDGSLTPDSLCFEEMIKEGDGGYTTVKIKFSLHSFDYSHIETCADDSKKVRVHKVVPYQDVREISIIGEKGWECLSVTWKRPKETSENFIFGLHEKVIPHIGISGESSVIEDEPLRQKNLKNAKRIIKMVKEGGMTKKGIKKN